MTKKLFILIILMRISFDIFSQNYNTCKLIREEIESTGIDQFEKYFQCDGVKCNGKQISYLKNGEISTKGNFINGKYIDTLYQNENTKIILRYFDKENNIEWYLNEDKSIIYSTSGIETTYYNKNRKKIKSIFVTNPPATYRKWIIEYDENENPIVEYSEDYLSRYLNKKIRKHIYNLDSITNNVYTISFNNDNKSYFLVRKYYNEFPIKENEIIEKSIIAIFKNEGDALYIYDLKKKKYYKIN